MAIDTVRLNVIPERPAQEVPSSLKMLRRGNDAELFWEATSDPTYNVRRCTNRTFTGPENQNIAPGLLVSHYLDSGALFSPPNLYYYKISASSCAGVEGPY
jgi:hypothetical protein